MAVGLRERTINVNCVLPTIIDTQDCQAAMPDADSARRVVPDDLASPIMFLDRQGTRDTLSGCSRHRLELAY